MAQCSLYYDKGNGSHYIWLHAFQEMRNIRRPLECIEIKVEPIRIFLLLVGGILGIFRLLSCVFRTVS
jgi:hypothetical protein